MKHVFLKGKRDEGGETIISYQDTDCWMRQMKTPYVDLPENEKDSNRWEADRMLALFPNPAPDPIFLYCEHCGFNHTPVACAVENGGEIVCTNCGKTNYIAVEKSLPTSAEDAEIERLVEWCDKEAKYFRTYGHPKRAKPYEETAAILRSMKPVKRHKIECDGQHVHLEATSVWYPIGPDRKNYLSALGEIVHHWQDKLGITIIEQEKT